MKTHVHSLTLKALFFFLLATIFVMAPSGCVVLDFTKERFFRYQTISDEILGVNLVLTMHDFRAARANVTDSTGDQVYKGPYQIRFRFHCEEVFDVINVKVKDLALVGHDSGNRIDIDWGGEPGGLVDYCRERRKESVTLSTPEIINLQYEDYELKAVLHIVRTGGRIDKTNLSYRIKRAYQEKNFRINSIFF